MVTMARRLHSWLQKPLIPDAWTRSGVAEGLPLATLLHAARIVRRVLARVDGRGEYSIGSPALQY